MRPNDEPSTDGQGGGITKVGERLQIASELSRSTRRLQVAVASLLGEASSGTTLVYLQRRPENSDAFAAARSGSDLA